jgi:hypothetical protein
LTAAATELQGSAAALTREALLLSGGKGLSAAFPGGKPGATAARAPIWSKIGAGIGAVAPYGGAMAGSALLPLGILGAGIYGAPYLFPDDDESARKRRAHGATIRNAYQSAWGYDSAGPEVTVTMRWGTGVGGDKGPLNVAVTAT